MPTYFFAGRWIGLVGQSSHEYQWDSGRPPRGTAVHAGPYAASAFRRAARAASTTPSSSREASAGLSAAKMPDTTAAPAQPAAMVWAALLTLTPPIDTTAGRRGGAGARPRVEDMPVGQSGVGAAAPAGPSKRIDCRAELAAQMPIRRGQLGRAAPRGAGRQWHPRHRAAHGSGNSRWGAPLLDMQTPLLR